MKDIFLKLVFWTLPFLFLGGQDVFATSDWENPNNPSVQGASSTNTLGDAGDNRRRGGALPVTTEVFDGQFFLDRATGDRGGTKGGTALQDYTGGIGKHEIGENMFRTTVINILNFLRKLLIPVILILITWSGIMLLLYRGKEDSISKNKYQILGMAIGFGLILLTISLVDKVLFGVHGELLVQSDSSVFARQGVAEILGVVRYVETFVVVIAIAFLIFAVFSLIFSGDEESEIDNLKKQIIYSGIGIITIVVIHNVVSFFIVGERVQTINPNNFQMLYTTLLRWGNVLLGVIAVVAVVSLVWGGTRLVASYGDDAAMEDAKKIIKFSIMGLVLAYSSYTIMRYVILPGG